MKVLMVMIDLLTVITLVVAKKNGTDDMNGSAGSGTMNGTGGMAPPPGIPPACYTVSKHQCLQMISPKYKMATEAFLYGVPIVIVIGTIGNILSLIVFLRWQMQQTVTYFYMAVLAIADLFVLYISALRLWITKLTDFDFMTISDAACKIFGFLPQWCTHFAAWILVTMTIDRFIAVHMPLRAIQFSTLWKARIAIFTVGAILFIIDMPILWKLELRREGCVPNDLNWHRVYSWVDMALYSFIPFLALAFFNIIIARDMIKARGTQLSLQGKTNDPQLNTFMRKINIKVTSMLLFVSTAFLCFTLPICILFIVREFGYSKNSLEGAIDYTVVATATQFLMYLNHSCNIFLYCLAGQKFRMSLTALCCKRQKRQNSVTGTAMSQTSRVRFSSSSSQRYSVNA